MRIISRKHTEKKPHTDLIQNQTRSKHKISLNKIDAPI